MDDAAPGHEIFRFLPFPFQDGRFPHSLGAVIQRTVLDGSLPALEVVHDADGSWMVADGVNDPNLPGACVAAAMHHVVERNASVADLATMPPGHFAVRDAPGAPWTVQPFDELSE